MDESVGLLPIKVVDSVDVVAEFAKHAVLDMSALCRDGVGDAMKGDHRVLGDEQSGILRLERKLDFLAEEKAWVGDFIAHLDEVFDGEVGNGVGVTLAGAFEVREYPCPVRALAIEQIEEDSAVLESTVQSLSEEGNDGVRGISEDESLAADVPW